MSPTAWAELAVSLSGCVRCPELAATRRSVVPGELPSVLPGAGVDALLIGEAPGAAEDASGRPFVGRSGELLDALLAEAGLPRERVAVANVLKCRPPANRTPRRAEVANCRPWLTAQLAAARPRLLVTLGGTAAQWCFGASARISALRELDPVPTYGGVPVVVTYHPSAAIRFGPNGMPRAALRADLVRAAALLVS